MDQNTFDKIRRIVHERSGIDVKEGKRSMVSARIARRLRELKLDDDQAYLERLKNDTGEIVELINVMSTNVTRFFREPAHFEFTTKIVRSWVEQGQTRMRFWSAASSTGQEPYSLAITLAEVFRETGRSVDARILATDISTRVLNYASSGQYTGAEIANMKDGVRRRYFETPRPGGDVHQVCEAIRDMVAFRRLNLNEPPFPMKGPLDIVYCCNVMIYFDRQTKQRLINEIYRLLKPGGFLIVSHTESLTGLTDLFKPVQPSIYTSQPSSGGSFRAERGALSA